MSSLLAVIAQASDPIRELEEIYREEEARENTIILYVLIGAAVVAALLYWFRSSKQAAEAEAKRQAVGRIMARCGPVLLYDNPPRIVGPVQMSEFEEREKTFRLEPGVTATVETAGSIAVTHGRNLLGKAAGGAATGGLGLFVFGNAAEKTHDTRELYLVVEAPDWAYVRPLDVNLGAQARQLASAINVAAKKLDKSAGNSQSNGAKTKGRTSGAVGTAGQPAAAGTSASGDTLAELARLQELLDRGTVTEAEFKELKAKILERSAKG